MRGPCDPCSYCTSRTRNRGCSPRPRPRVQLQTSPAVAAADPIRGWSGRCGPSQWAAFLSARPRAALHRPLSHLRRTYFPIAHVLSRGRPLSTCVGLVWVSLLPCAAAAVFPRFPLPPLCSCARLRLVTPAWPRRPARAPAQLPSQPSPATAAAGAPWRRLRRPAFRPST